jgi:hypothetical protein
MDIDLTYFNARKEKAKENFFAQKTIRNPYFGIDITLNSDRFHHLQFSNRRERSKQEQLLKLNLLPLAFEIIRKSGTIQEYRKLLTPIGKKSPSDGSIPMKNVEYWGLIGIVGEKRIKVRTVLRRVGDGNIIFWSVMLYSKIKNNNQKLYMKGIEDE